MPRSRRKAAQRKRRCTCPGCAPRLHGALPKRKSRQPVLSGRQLLTLRHTLGHPRRTPPYPNRCGNGACGPCAASTAAIERRYTCSTHLRETVSKGRTTTDEAQAARAADLRRNAARDDVTTRLTTGAAAARGLSGGGHCHCSHQGRGGGTPRRPRAALKTPGPDRGRLATEPRKCARAPRPRTTACYPDFPRAV